jgi:hypothetical protein
MTGETMAVIGAVILMAAVLGAVFIDPTTKPKYPEVDTAYQAPDMAQLDDDEAQG